MSSISNLLEIGRQGIRAHQQSLATTAHNISNVNTKGFSRQEAILETSPPLSGLIGSGVRVSEVRRNVDTFLEAQLTDLTSALGQLSARQNLLVQAQGAVTETNNSGIAQSISAFFNAVRDVATNPEDTVQRTVLVNQANAVADQLTQAGQTFENLRRNADGEIGRHITTINDLASRIASLNDQIYKAEAGGKSALDLRDKRQSSINDLAELVNVTTLDMPDGVTVEVGGQLLVGGNQANSLAQVADAEKPGLNDVAFVRTDGTKLVITSQIGDGKIKGLLTLRDSDIVGFQDRLDRLAAVLVTTFNEQHKIGFGLDGSTNTNFFGPLSPNAPLAKATNTGGAVGTSVTISTPASLTFDTYQITFSAPGTFDVLDTTKGTTVLSAQSYTSGNPIVFDGITAVLTNGSGPPATGDIFTVTAHQGAAKGFSVAVTNTDKIAASSTLAGIPGNNVNALALVDIQTTRQSTLGNVTLNDYQAITAGNVGSTTADVQSSKAEKEAELEQAKSLREGVSGVSLDEELTNLLSFQRFFEASARLITVANTLLGTVISLGQ